MRNPAGRGQKDRALVPKTRARALCPTEVRLNPYLVAPGWLYGVALLVVALLTGVLVSRVRLRRAERRSQDLEAKVAARAAEIVRQKDDLAEANRELSRLIRQLEEKSAQVEDARVRAEQASQAKTEFLANMSHEIRTPMTAIVGMTDLALETQLTAEQRRYLTTIQSSTDALLVILNEVLDFSKIEAGKIELDPVAFRLRESVGSTLRALALRAHEKGLELASDIAPDVPTS